MKPPTTNNDLQYCQKLSAPFSGERYKSWSVHVFRLTITNDHVICLTAQRRSQWQERQHHHTTAADSSVSTSGGCLRHRGSFNTVIYSVIRWDWLCIIIWLEAVFSSSQFFLTTSQVAMTTGLPTALSRLTNIATNEAFQGSGTTSCSRFRSLLPETPYNTNFNSP